MSTDLGRYARELLRDSAPVERVLGELPPVPAAPERVIRASVENVDRAIARALAQAALFGELTKIEIMSDPDVEN